MHDFVTADGYETAWSEFADVIGMDYLCAMHINDSKKGVGHGSPPLTQATKFHQTTTYRQGFQESKEFHPCEDQPS